MRRSSPSVLLALDQKTRGWIHQSIHLPDEIPAFLTNPRTLAIYTVEANARSIPLSHLVHLPRRAVSKWTSANG
jgi:hypothetical protein